MNNEFRDIIDDLIQGIDAIKAVWSNIRELNPDFEQVSVDHWRKKEARCWLHGATKMQEAVELEQWLYYYSEESKTAKSPASIHCSNWREFVREEGVYLDFAPANLLEPEKDETLLNFIQKHAKQVEDNGWGNKRTRRAFKSFLAYLRRFNDQEEVAFIDYFFPEKMDIQHRGIIRIIRPQVYPISEEIAADIVKELAFKCAYGRPNAQFKAAEALALSWLCLTASRIRFPRSLEMVHAIPAKDLLLNGKYPELFIPSDFGKRKIRISSRVAKFLEAVIKIPSDIPRKTILQSSLHDLRRPLNDAIDKASPPSELGEITFLTFLSSPHHFGEHIRHVFHRTQDQ